MINHFNPTRQCNYNVSLDPRPIRLQLNARSPPPSVQLETDRPGVEARGGDLAFNWRQIGLGVRLLQCVHLIQQIHECAQ